MVVNPGWQQIGDTLLVTVSTCGISAAMFGRFVRQKHADILLRSLLALVSFVVMFHPNGNVAVAAAVIALPAIVYGVFRHRLIAPPKSGLRPEPTS
jgi:hypothetical protein